MLEIVDVIVFVLVFVVEVMLVVFMLVEDDNDIEKGVDLLVWDNEGELVDVIFGDDIMCVDVLLVIYFFILVGGNMVDDCGCIDFRVLVVFDVLMKDVVLVEFVDLVVLLLCECLFSGFSVLGRLL